jgi:hypothetical protein
MMLIGETSTSERRQPPDRWNIESESTMADDPYQTPLTPPTTPPVIDPDTDPGAAAQTSEDPDEQGTTAGRRSKRPSQKADESETTAQGRRLDGAGEEDLNEAGSPEQMLSD